MEELKVFGKVWEAAATVSARGAFLTLFFVIILFSGGGTAVERGKKPSMRAWKV